LLGIIFESYIEYLEEEFGVEVCESIVDRACPDGNSSFTAVGNYSFDRMLDFVVATNKITQVETHDLLRSFGLYLFPKLMDGYGSMLGEINHSFEMIECIENHIHVEVKKLYPNAELPTFKTDKTEDGKLIVEYQSARPLASLAAGLLEGCCKHFKNEVTIAKTDRTPEEGYGAVFELKELNG
jgi:hypothetical protein